VATVLLSETVLPRDTSSFKRLICSIYPQCRVTKGVSTPRDLFSIRRYRLIVISIAPNRERLKQSARAGVPQRFVLITTISNGTKVAQEELGRKIACRLLQDMSWPCSTTRFRDRSNAIGLEGKGSEDSPIYKD
jgi:hypothetical protein